MQLLQIHEPGQTPMPHEDTVAVGIDLGTTHSVVAISEAGVPQAIFDADGQSIIPSVVAYSSHAAIVGKAAKQAYSEGKPDVIASVKRLMGKSASDIPQVAGQVPYTLEATGEGMARIALSARSITPIEVSADILKHLMQMAEISLGKPVEKAVITVPAYFDDAARSATKDAAKLAGIEVLRLLNEPTAAALAYGLEHGAEGIYVIYDLGGGTCDISVLKLKQGVFQVLSTAGDTLLGGDDMDHALAHDVLSKAGNPTLSSGELAVLLAACRNAKEALSDAQSVSLTFSGKPYVITRAAFETLAEPFIKRTLLCAEQALQDAKLETQDIKGVVLVGGATRIPAVKAAVAHFFGQKPLDSIDPDTVVALGAALQAEALTRGSDNLLLDVLPLSLGLETMGGIIEKIIYRNTPIPVSTAQEFTTYQDGQTAMKIHVLQGEREKVEDCRSLAEFALTGIPPMVAGMARIRVQFTVDADGLLTVSAEETTTGTKQEIAVQPSYGLNLEEMQHMLLAAQENAQRDIVERLMIEARVEAERLAQDVEKAIHAQAGLLKPGEREMFAAQLDTLRQAMSGSDRERLDYEVQQLNVMVGPFAERRMNAAISQAFQGKHIEEAI